MKDDPFFNNIQKNTLEMDGEHIEFPVLYYDFRFVSCNFTTKTNLLKRLLPHPNFKPVEIWPGVCTLGITAFEYLDTSIGPYNEIAIAVPIKFPPSLVIPGISLLSMLKSNKVSLYIHHLPVTTEIAYKGGVYFYNYPKFLSEITFNEKNDNIEVILKQNNMLILKLNAKKLPLKFSTNFQYHTYSIKENTVMHTLIEGKAPKLGQTMIGKMGELELGEHSISQELKELNLSNVARGGQYGEGVMTKLHSPDQRWNIETLEVI